MEDLKCPCLVSKDKHGDSYLLVIHNSRLSITFPIKGLSKNEALEFARKMGFSKQCVDQAADWMIRLYDLFIEKDAVMVEINPMSEDLLGRGIILLLLLLLSMLFILSRCKIRND